MAGTLTECERETAGLGAPIPFCFSLDGMEGEAWIADTSESEYIVSTCVSIDIVPIIGRFLTKELNLRGFPAD